MRHCHWGNWRGWGEEGREQSTFVSHFNPPTPQPPPKPTTDLGPLRLLLRQMRGALLQAPRGRGGGAPPPPRLALPAALIPAHATSQAALAVASADGRAPLRIRGVEAPGEGVGRGGALGGGRRGRVRRPLGGRDDDGGWHAWLGSAGVLPPTGEERESSGGGVAGRKKGSGGSRLKYPGGCGFLLAASALPLLASFLSVRVVVIGSSRVRSQCWPLYI